MEDLNGFAYLDWVVRESLRLYPTLPHFLRVPTKDTELPLSKPFVDKSGREVNSIRLRKGQPFYVPIHAMNKRKELFGEDADEFRYGRSAHACQSRDSQRVLITTLGPRGGRNPLHGPSRTRRCTRTS